MNNNKTISLILLLSLAISPNIVQSSQAPVTPVEQAKPIEQAKPVEQAKTDEQIAKEAKEKAEIRASELYQELIKQTNLNEQIKTVEAKLAELNAEKVKIQANAEDLSSKAKEAAELVKSAKPTDFTTATKAFDLEKSSTEAAAKASIAQEAVKAIDSKIQVLENLSKEVKSLIIDTKKSPMNFAILGDLADQIKQLPRITSTMTFTELNLISQALQTKKLGFFKGNLERMKLLAKNPKNMALVLKHPYGSPIASIATFFGINSAAYQWYSSKKASALALASEALAKKDSLAKAAAEKAPFNRFVKRPVNFCITRPVNFCINSKIVQTPLNLIKAGSNGIAKGTNGTISAAKKHPIYASVIGISILALSAYEGYKYYNSLKESEDQQ